MLFMTTIAKLISPLRSMLEGNSTHDLTGLLAINAITANLEPLIEIQADLSAFAENVKVLFAKHFPADYISKQEQHHHSSIALLRKNQAVLMEQLDTVYDSDLPPCAFAPHVIDRCKAFPHCPGSFRAVLEAEVSRTRECTAKSIAPAHKGMTALASSWLEDCRDLYSLFSANFGSYMPRDEQDYEFRGRFLNYWDDLLELKTNTSASWSLDRWDYLYYLEATYLRARADTEGAVSLDGSVMFDDWDAMDFYWTTLCARGQPLEGEGKADNSTTSLLPAIFLQSTLW
jgi:hypothetical protein